ncbi:hypothetical protein GCM10009593_30470 [Microlunatus antarcticus]|uniref:Uncharacterized protein n=1 Tax=Microlunatus antarcticus TaxID=53388 RepID=A0A7W5JSD1_9ACTN|nr:hypothetical protein [Microlunatus antarcticus]
MTRLGGRGWAEESTSPLDYLRQPSRRLGWTDDGRTVLALYQLESRGGEDLAGLEMRLVGLALKVGVLVRRAGFGISN